MSGVVVWLTGLPQSGKSTLAARVAERLPHACLLDSDELRDALVPAHGYDDTGRDQFYETVANLAGLLGRQGSIVLVAATANLRRYRQRARERSPAFIEVFVDAPVAECEQRDRKGLYRERPATLPGVGAPYEPPEHPDVVASGGHDDGAVSAILDLVRARAPRA